MYYKQNEIHIQHIVRIHDMSCWIKRIKVPCVGFPVYFAIICAIASDNENKHNNRKHVIGYRTNDVNL